jgi:hypothetical protein
MRQPGPRRASSPAKAGEEARRLAQSIATGEPAEPVAPTIGIGL